jgi:hypothetical protein
MRSTFETKASQRFLAAALSRVSLTHAASFLPALAAATAYLSRRSSLILTVSHRLSRTSTSKGGLPLPRFGAFMGQLCTNK